MQRGWFCVSVCVIAEVHFRVRFKRLSEIIQRRSFEKKIGSEKSRASFVLQENEIY